MLMPGKHENGLQFFALVCRKYSDNTSSRYFVIIMHYVTFPLSGKRMRMRVGFKKSQATYTFTFFLFFIFIFIN